MITIAIYYKFFINCKEINSGKINASEINSISIGSDFIAVNNEKGHYEIGNKIGKSINIETDKNILVFVGGILVDVKEK